MDERKIQAAIIANSKTKETLFYMTAKNAFPRMVQSILGDGWVIFICIYIYIYICIHFVVCLSLEPWLHRYIAGWGRWCHHYIMLYICHWRHREIAYAFVFAFVLFIFNRSYYVHHLHYWKWIEEYKIVKQWNN